jgi:hypothetical protein
MTYDLTKQVWLAHPCFSVSPSEVLMKTPLCHLLGMFERMKQSGVGAGNSEE